MLRESKSGRLDKIYIALLLGLAVGGGVLVSLIFGGGRVAQGLRGWAEKGGILLRRPLWEIQAEEPQGNSEAKLRRRIQALEFEIAELRRENKALRKQLEAPLPPDLELLPAKIIGRSNFLYIDMGGADGVVEGAVVITEEVLVGVVAEVGEFTASVGLPVSPQIKIPVKTSRGALGLTSGGGGEKIELGKVLQSEELEVGDIVATSGNGGLPAGIVIGKVSALLESEKEVYQRAEVEPEVDYGRLLDVFVVR